MKAMKAYLPTTLLLCQILLGCSTGDSLSRIEDSGILKVATRSGPTTYYIDKGEATGFEHALATLFAEELGAKLEIHTEQNVTQILHYMRRQQADLAAAALIISPVRSQEFQFSHPYYDIDPQVVYLTGSTKPRQLSDLPKGKLVVAAGSAHAETLTFLKELQPDLSWIEITGADPTDLMDMVSTGSADFTIIDSNEFVANRSFHPKLRLGFNIDRNDKLAWLFPPGNQHLRLKQRADLFLQRIEEDGTLDQLKEHHFGHAWGINPVGAQTFSRKMRRDLPKYEGLIHQVAEEFQMDWHLLAAIAYQESRWNPRAKSPTGVRGMMMLTRTTALEMGIKDRLEPLQSLRGGARYLKKIRRLLPEDIMEPDRTWFTLAAYNIGRGHLEDARKITERHGGDPHLWLDVKENLPLLQKRKYYASTRYGYARGSEPVTYVQNIRHYYSILSWRDVSQELPPIDINQYLPESVQSSKLLAL